MRFELDRKSARKGGPFEFDIDGFVIQILHRTIVLAIVSMPLPETNSVSGMKRVAERPSVSAKKRRDGDGGAATSQGNCGEGSSVASGGAQVDDVEYYARLRKVTRDKSN